MSTRRSNRSPHPPIAERRIPRQARSQKTLEAILDATAQVVQQFGEEGFNTNRIAERAGVSIGTLYQYVPDKDALLDLWAQRWRAATVNAIDAAIAHAMQAPATLEVLTQAIVRPVLVQFATAPAHRELVRLAWQRDDGGRILEGLRLVAERISLQLQPWAHRQGLVISPEQVYLATRAVVGTIRFAVLDRSPLLDSAAFEDGLTRMAVAALLSGPLRSASL